jgi:hypothetical protein
LKQASSASTGGAANAEKTSVSAPSAAILLQ